MDSFPPDFTQQIYPLLYVAGLNPPPPAPPPPTAQQPQQAPPAAPSPPPAPSNDPFVILQAALRKTFASRKGSQLWDTSRGTTHDFHTVLVDKNVRFPPLKARPTTSSPQQPPPALHSPISPLTPTSPLYPDGIIAPIWIRKHRELVPSVFILVLRLFEHEQGQASHNPLDPSAREEEERGHDAELVREIVERKRSTLERGIKLAVVLLCSRALLDDPALDFRLSLIRRQSGLDSRASLFVISPVPQSEVNNFVQSIRAELYPAALDYYREHGRRVRRKRARQIPKGGLNERGWNVRYDYKLALFAEMRSEIEVSLKHYEDCYDVLVDMFAQPGLLAPRTKRWAEAKVLADCVSIKISKFYLYLNEPSRALAQLNSHVSKFRELSVTWQIGEETFEFWSWLSKQYRLFGDLTSLALRNGFRLPTLKPPPTPRALPPGTSPSALPSPGLMPLNVLQHAGFYYELAAVCAVERRERFRAAKREVEEREEQEGADGAKEGLNTPAMAHEMKVDHTEIIIELFTKAYEFFKAHKAKNMTYFIAAQIASAHYENGKHEMAFRFHDRISKNYRPRQWRDILDRGILARSFRSAVELEDWEAAVRIGLEVAAPGSHIDPDDRELYAGELLQILKTKTPLSPEKATILTDSADTLPLFDCRLTFHTPTTPVSTPVPFQLVLSSPPTARSSGLSFTSLDIHFNDDRPPISVQHADPAEGEGGKEVEKVNLGSVGAEQERKANLRWQNGAVKVFSGAIALDRELTLTVDKVVLHSAVGEWKLALTLRPDGGAKSPVWYVGEKTVAVTHASPSVCRVVRRDLRTEVTTAFDAPAYLGERFPVNVDFKNDDEVDVQVFLVLFLQPGDDGAQNRVLIDDQSSASVIESLSLGTLSPGSSLRKTFHLESLGPPGARFVDVTIRAIPTISPGSPSAASLPPAAIPSPTESTLTLSIATLPPFTASFDVQSFPSRRRAVKPLLDLARPDGWEGASEVGVVATLGGRGPWEVEVESVRVRCEEAMGMRVVESSLEDAPLASVWRPRDLSNAIFRLDVKPLLHEQQLPASGAALEVTWRRTGASSPLTTTILPLPALTPLPLLPRITLRLPPSLTLHTPTLLTYTFSNPTPRLLTLSSQIDAAPLASSFVFAGPRRLPEWVLAPGEEREVGVQVVPLMVGEHVLPRMRVWEVEHPPPGVEHALVDEEGRPLPPPAQPQPQLRELEVFVESEADVAGEEEGASGQAELEADLRSARGEEGAVEGEGGAAVGKAPRVLVLPR
ncbi:hypothetical protein JCM6882_008227 [Rhodosporidiobolus microsporus]